MELRHPPRYLVGVSPPEKRDPEIVINEYESLVDTLLDRIEEAIWTMEEWPGAGQGKNIIKILKGE